jgi:hypothetical protein
MDYQNNNLQILNVEYGKNDNSINITSKIIELFFKDNQLFIPKETNLNDLFGDPCFGIEKEIKINALVDNIPIYICEKESNCLLMNDIHIYEKQLQILNVEYGKNDKYTNITSKTKELFFKENKFFIPKETNLNDLFGDPCFGIEKEIKINALLDNIPIHICEKESNCLLTNDIILYENKFKINLFRIQEKLIHKNICFIHFTNINNDDGFCKSILMDQINYIKSTNLYNKLDFIFITMLGKYTEIINDDKIKLIYYSPNIYEWEFPNYINIKYFCDNIPFNVNILEIHTKGVLKKQYSYEWRKYLEYFLIEQHETCLELLKNYKCVGVNQQFYFDENKYKNHFSGNFWWARSDYLKTLPQISYNDDRYSVEHWIIGNLYKNDYRNFISLHHSSYDLYKTPIMPYEYKLEIIKNAICYNLKYNFVKPKPTYGVYFICCIGNYLNIINNQIQHLIDSGLYNECDKIICFVCMVTDECIEILKKYNKIQIISTNENLYEKFAINNYKNYIHTEDYYLFYIHSKSVTRKEKCNNDWTDLCNYFTINKWRLNIELLTYYDCVGINLKNYPKKHYSGNFWWAKSEHLNKLKNINDGYLSCEMYVLGYPKTNYVSLYQSYVNHGDTEHDKSLYNFEINPTKNVIISNEIKTQDILFNHFYNFPEISNDILDSIDDFILIVDMPNWGGGTNFFIDLITSCYTRTSNLVIVRNFNEMLYVYINYQCILKTKYNVDESILFVEKYQHKINKIFFNHIISHSKRFINKLLNINKHTTYITHDYYFLCDLAQMFYNEIDNLHQSYKIKNHYIDINLIDNIITQNEANINIFGKYYKKQIDVIELPDFKNGKEMINTNNSQIVVGIIGIISKIKGSEILEQIINLYKNSNIVFVVFGKTNIPGFTNHYLYKNVEELNSLLIQHKPNLLLELSVWPETYSYTLSLAMITDLPIIYFKKDFPSVIENRLEKYNKKYPFTNYEELFTLFNQYKQDFFYTIEETIYFDTKWSDYFDTKWSDYFNINNNSNEKYNKSDEKFINNICIVPDFNPGDKHCIKFCGDIDLSSEPPILELN